MSVIPNDCENTTKNPPCMIRRKIYFSESLIIKPYLVLQNNVIIFKLADQETPLPHKGVFVFFLLAFYQTYEPTCQV